MIAYFVAVACLGFAAALPTGGDSELECFCTRDYRPVCGTDGKTYANKCLLECAGVGEAYTGACNEPCPCHKDYRPVCGTDGKTYGNRCMLECANILEAYEGECKPPCACQLIYKPVCGLDGKTYGNQCELECNNVLAAYEGECKPVCACPRIYMPVCGQDGNTYANQCEMNCKGVAFFQDGACTVSPASNLEDDPIPCICTLIYLPVCGTDNLTYGNKCNLDCAGIGFKHDGPCDSNGGAPSLVNNNVF